MACGHSEPFVSADQEIQGPFAAGEPLRLTYSPWSDYEPGLSPDGAWLTYQFERGTGDHDRCIAILPALGGQRHRELCAWQLDQVSSADGLANATLRADGMIAFTLHSGLIGALPSTTAALYLAPADSIAGAARLLPLLVQPSGATGVWSDLIDPIWLDDHTLLVLGARRFLRSIGPKPAYAPLDFDRTPPVDTLTLGVEFATISTTSTTAAVGSIAPAMDAIAWDLDRSTGNIHYIVQRVRPGDADFYHESIADTLLRMPATGGPAVPLYGVPVAGSERALEQLHGVASGHGRVFVSRSWRSPAQTQAGPVLPGAPLAADIAEVLADGSLRVIATAVSWRWGKLRLSPDGRYLYAEAVERTSSDIYRIAVAP